MISPPIILIVISLALVAVAIAGMRGWLNQALAVYVGTGLLIVMSGVFPIVVGSMHAMEWR